MTAGHYAIDGCADDRISVIYSPATPVTGKPYLCCCGHEAIIRSYTLWGWWAICFVPGCIMHKRYTTLASAVRRAHIHDTYHRGDVHVYEGTKLRMYTPLSRITQPQLGD